MSRLLADHEVSAVIVAVRTKGVEELEFKFIGLRKVEYTSAGNIWVYDGLGRPGSTEWYEDVFEFARAYGIAL